MIENLFVCWENLHTYCCSSWRPRPWTSAIKVVTLQIPGVKCRHNPYILLQLAELKQYALHSRHLRCPFSDVLFNQRRISNPHNHTCANVISQFQEASVGLVLDLGCTINNAYLMTKYGNTLHSAAYPGI